VAILRLELYAGPDIKAHNDLCISNNSSATDVILLPLHPLSLHFKITTNMPQIKQQQGER